jgi:hypothetical protein
MTGESKQDHWNAAYSGKGEAGVSWFEDRPEISLDLIRRIGATPDTTLIDVGGGASRLADALLGEGWTSVSVLDFSGTALRLAMTRLGKAAERVTWIEADVTRWIPDRAYDLWHDRATFHFLIAPEDRAAYIERLCLAVRLGGHAIIATFALDGPERCSGLPVIRYSPATLAEALGPPFKLVEERRHVHTTPWGSTQAFQFSVLRRVPL